jgi:hypothetical protein
MRYNVSTMRMTNAERQRKHRIKKAAERAKMAKHPCACGCGTMIPPVGALGSPQTYAHGHNPTSTEFAKGDPRLIGNRYAAGRNGPRSHRWNGGEHRVGGGYWRTTIDEATARLHPTAFHGKGWSIIRSHMVWDQTHPDDPVLPGDAIHHINHDRGDDRPENLQKMPSCCHARMHAKENPQPRGNLGRFVSRH